MKNVYMDAAATTPVDPRVVAAASPYFSDSYGNPSSIHGRGRDAATAVAQARRQVASLVGARPDNIVFTGGGTEADNNALKGVFLAAGRQKNHIITTAIEHHAVFASAEYLQGLGCEVTVVPVDSFGMVDPDDISKAITGRTVLISVMHANNEIGSIQPVAEIGRLCREYGVYFHTDAVQTVGHLPIDVEEMGVHLLAMSAHKMNGPKGVGALYIRDDVACHPLLHGGAQEDNRRASTENVPGIVGFGKAAELALELMDEEISTQTALRKQLVEGIGKSIPDTYLNGHPDIRLPNNVNISFDYIDGEALCLSLDSQGVYTSTGSACSSESNEPSHVLSAIGVSPVRSHSALRFSLGRYTTSEDIDYALGILPGIVEKLRAISPLFGVGKVTECHSQEDKSH
ncbi:cysteine desulfurase NifS [Chloroflexota bacterium]